MEGDRGDEVGRVWKLEGSNSRLIKVLNTYQYWIYSIPLACKSTYINKLAVSEKNMNMNSILIKYFKPKKFEYYRDRTIYDLIGVKIYKKYLPTTGDLVSRKRGIKQIDLTKSNRYEELYRYESKTRNYELRHIIGAFAFVGIRFLFDSELRLTVLDFTILPAMNLYINIYPIFLQRYNRIRILKILKKNGQLSLYDSI